MNQRERFIKYMAGEKVDRVPNMEIIPWPQTIARWFKEGLSESAKPEQMFVGGNEYFGLDGVDVVDVDLLPPYPKRENIILEEDDRYKIFIDEFGRTRKALKAGESHGVNMSMDHYMDFAVNTDEDFAEYRKGYTEDTVHMRYPKDWGNIVKKANASQRPVSLLDPMVGTFGFYSMLRDFMGTEGLSYMFYDNPNLVQEAIEMLLEYALVAFKKVVTDINLDYYILHEDMCFKSGPLLSPKIFKDMFFVPYVKFIDFLKSNGVKHIMMDTDGNFDQLLPMFIDAGIDSISPCEAAAGMDVVRLRKEYPMVGFMGGIDKREIAKGGKAAEEEVKYKIGSIIDKGRYIPMIDHSIPPDISLKNFEWYLELKRKYIE